MNLYFLQKNLPIILYIILYSIFSVVGITFFFLDNDFYLSLYEIFSGVSRPSLTLSKQYINLFLIAFLSPFLFILSYLFVSNNFLKTLKLDMPLNISPKVCLVAYFLICAFLSYRIFNIINVQDIIYAYTNYNSQINIRFFLFQNLNSLDWIFLYSFIPALTGILYYILKSNTYIILFFSIFILLFTMQKKYVLVLFIFIFLIHFFKSNFVFKEIFLKFCGLGVILLLVFFVQTNLPGRFWTDTVYYKIEKEKNNNRGFEINERNNKNEINKESLPSFSNKGRSLSYAEIKEKKQQLNLSRTELKYYYFILAIFNRISIPSIYYFELFPYKKEFLGFSHTHFLPLKENVNEGKLMWEYLNGDFAAEGGSCAGPFNFSLYARLGIWGTLLASLLLGAFLGGCWSLIQSLERPFPKTIFSSMFCIFMIFMSMDNFRASSFTAYGIFWWALCYFLLFTLSKSAAFLQMSK